jgi:hypothetical protein
VDDNLDRMQNPWHPPTPVEQLFKQIEIGKKFANDGSDPLSDHQIVHIAYNIVNDTGRFSLATRDWRSKIATDQTWTNFQTFFTAAYKDLQLTDTICTTGFHGAANHASNHTATKNNSTQLASTKSALAVSEKTLAAALADNAVISTPTAPQPQADTRYCWSHGTSRNRPAIPASPVAPEPPDTNNPPLTITKWAALPDSTLTPTAKSVAPLLQTDKEGR